MGEANVRFEVSFLFLRVKQPSNTPFLLLKTRETRPKNDGKTIWPNGLPDRVYYDNEYHQQKQKVITMKKNDEFGFSFDETADEVRFEITMKKPKAKIQNAIGGDYDDDDDPPQFVKTFQVGDYCFEATLKLIPCPPPEQNALGGDYDDDDDQP